MHTICVSLIERLKALWPTLLGIICARCAFVGICYNGYQSIDNGIRGDEAVLASCILLLIALLFHGRFRQTAGDNRKGVLFMGCIAVAAVASIALEVSPDGFSPLPGLAFAADALCATALTGCLLYWLCRLCDADETTVAISILCAIMASSVLTFLLDFLPQLVASCCLPALILVQLLLAKLASLKGSPISHFNYRRSRTFFGLALDRVQDSNFLTGNAVTIGVLGLIGGCLYSYPGTAAFCPGTLFHMGYAILVSAACIFVITLVILQRERAMTVCISILIEILALLSLVLFAAFPNSLGIGSMLVNTLNALTSACCWYVIVAFATFGKQHLFHYVVGGWIACFGIRSASRLVLFFILPSLTSTPLLNSLLALLILLATQLIFVQLLIAERKKDARAAQEQEDIVGERLQQAEQLLQNTQRELEEATSTLESLADATSSNLEQNNGTSILSNESLQERVEAMGRQFLLTNREVDVLALYVLGYTQKKVAEKLFVSQSTVHSHLKHVFHKCGLSSRQKILDYLDTWKS